MELRIDDNLTGLQQRVFDIMQRFGYTDFFSDFQEFQLSQNRYIQYAIAKEFTDTVANSDNFYKNSICFWKETSYVPKREPDYTSLDRYGDVSSQYWYTPNGVYRRSNHWGDGVASCDWYFKDSKYNQLFNEIAVHNRRYVGFADWKDFAAKGYLVTQNGDLDKLKVMGFEFKTTNDYRSDEINSQYSY